MLNNFSAKKNKKAQIGETMTWIVATIIIIVVLSIFIYTSDLLSKTKNLTLADSKISLDKDKDIIKIKSSFAYEKTLPEKKPLAKEWVEKNEK
jgi:hypothetical protein